MPERRDESWHLKKEINIAHLLTTIAMLVSVLWFMSDLDKRIDANTLNIQFVKKSQADDQIRNEKVRAADQKRLEKSLDGINAKLDRLISK